MGLANCTHLLALISTATRGSWWVPYEIGSVRGRSKQLAFFVHKEVRDLPDYLVYGWAKEVSSKRYLTESRADFMKSARNPLAELLPSIRYQ
jgi:hypothetical protein